MSADKMYRACESKDQTYKRLELCIFLKAGVHVRCHTTRPECPESPRAPHTKPILRARIRTHRQFRPRLQDPPLGRSAPCVVTRPSPLQTPKNQKIQRHKKATQKLLLGSRPKWLKSYLKVTQKWLFGPFSSLLSNFWVTLAGSPKITFE